MGADRSILLGIGSGVHIRRVLGLILLFAVLSGCAAGKVPAVRPSEGAGGGTAFVYLKPFPREADRFFFSIERVSARREDGQEIPFLVNLKEIEGRHLKRERLLAQADLPPGRYLGLSFTVGKATLETEEGRADLRVPQEPVRIDFSFSLRKGQALVLSMAVLYADSIQEGFFFSPVVSLAIPAKPNPALTGFVSSRDGNVVTVFDKLSGEVAGILPAGRNPSGMVLDPRGMKAYVAITGEDSIGVINILSSSSIDVFRLRSGDRPQELALTPDGATLVVANSGSRTVSLLAPPSLTELSRITVGEGPRSVVVDASGKKAFVFNTLSDSISVIDIPSRTVFATIPTDPRPLRGQLNHKGERLYIIHENSPLLTVLDPLSLAVVKRAFVGGGVIGLRVGSAIEQIYLSKRRGDRVEVYDPVSFSPRYVLATGGEVSYMTMDEEENPLVLVMPEEKSIKAVNPISRTTILEIDLGAEPYWVSLMGER